MAMAEARWTPEPRCAATDDGKVCAWSPNHDGAAGGRHYDEVFGSWAEPGSLAERSSQIAAQRDGSRTVTGARRRSGSTVRQ
jgi:hypothetical protein